ncbi:hypothetical protein [Pontibacter vulgaris]|uniref:hypothetical protein n=1 Tax=Pontibacter vulgaris TaxID=2905679 RepID=UPI001FA797CE|nr:hypothetical protein [Pontibacter vulgaris]
MRTHPLYTLFFALTTVALSIVCFGCASKNFFSESPLVKTPDSSAIKSDVTPLLDSVTVQAGRHYAHGKFYNFLLGQHYREVWAAPVRVKVLYLQQQGFQIEKVGGNLQTTSFTLVNDKGLRYALRSLDKDPAGSLSPLLRQTFVADFMRDQTAALNPYAALVVAPLAEAAGIPHANPKLVYLPPDSVILGKYTLMAGDKLYMLEEKLDDRNWYRDEAGSLSDIISSKKLLKRRFKDNKHQVDAIAFAKERLFDLLLNDRDRHQGQWEWLEFKAKDQTLYKPVPKDRDQAFYKFAHGVLPHLFGRGLNYQKFTGFHNDYRNLHALMLKSAYIDQQFLSEITEAEFDSLAKDLQQRLTDKVIANAVHKFPGQVYSLVGAITEQSIKSRRDLLPVVAHKYYKLLAKVVVIVGSDEKENFIVERLDDERMLITMHRAKDNAVLYHRVFYLKDTKEIRIYGLADDDQFKVSGKVNKSIKVSIIGGKGEDEVEDISHVKGWSKHTIVYDKQNGNHLKLGSESKFRISANHKISDFDREGF